MNILNTIELYTLNKWIVWSMNYISIKLLFKKNQKLTYFFTVTTITFHLFLPPLKFWSMSLGFPSGQIHWPLWNHPETSSWDSIWLGYPFLLTPSLLLWQLLSFLGTPFQLLGPDYFACVSLHPSLPSHPAVMAPIQAPITLFLPPPPNWLQWFSLSNTSRTSPTAD